VAELSNADYRALARFRYALRVFLRFSEEAARSAGLTPNQHQLLLAVRGWDGDGPPSMSDLAERLQLAPHSTLELARRAEEAGLVELAVDDDDRRRQLVALTPAGRDTLAELTSLHRDELRRFRQEMRDVLHVLDRAEG
jgi:DNA-binding MarR family transcriptional regulator